MMFMINGSDHYHKGTNGIPHFWNSPSWDSGFKTVKSTVRWLFIVEYLFLKLSFPYRWVWEFKDGEMLLYVHRLRKIETMDILHLWLSKLWIFIVRWIIIYTSTKILIAKYILKFITSYLWYNGELVFMLIS